MIRRAIEVLREEGVRVLGRRSIQFAYENGIRDLLPRMKVEYNGIPTRAGRILDPLVPGHSLDKPGYEEAIIDALRQYVRRGDHVVAVGGGWGVSATVAAKRAGEGGHVRVYEGARESVKHVRETIELNDCTDRVSVEHAIVGREISLYSESGGAPFRGGSEIPACDVLVLDCEGAELDILDDLVVNPSTIIVETHGFLDAPEKAVRERLFDLGYTVRQCSVAESVNADFCEENGIYVLVATLRQE